MSDKSRQMSRDYGVLLEKSGMDLLGSYLIDPEGIVQQMTINNIAVGRSVLESLRLVEAFQAVVEKGVLCPANWNPDDDLLDEEETHADREEKMMKDFEENLQIKDLDHNTNVPFTLALPRNVSRTSEETSRGSSKGPGRQGSAGSAVTAIHKAGFDHNSTGSNRNSQSHARDSTIVTLDFADPLAAGDADSPNPKEFVNMDMEPDLRKRLSQNDMNGAGHGRSPSASSPTSTTAAQRTVEALKRMSGLGSPRVESPSGHKRTASGGKTGYFD